MRTNMASRSVLLLVMVASVVAEPLHQYLHRHMTAEEKHHYLGEGAGEFEVIYIKDSARYRDNRSRYRRGTSEEEDLVFEAFGRPYNLRLERNRNLLNGGTRIVHRLYGNNTREHVRGTSGDCHFIHAGQDVTAAVSKCWGGQLRGFISDGHVMLDIAPLSPRLSGVLHKRAKRSPATHGFPHLARRTKSHEVDRVLQTIRIKDDYLFPDELHGDPAEPDGNDLDSDSHLFSLGAVEVGEDRIPTAPGRKMIELGLYVDKAAREIFLPFFDNDSDAFIDFILGFINQIQALYYLPSLGTKVDISINYLEIMEEQQVKHYEGERAQLLTSFCRYNTKLNRRAAGVNDWDMGLYLSGLNFFEMVEGERSPVTMGLAVISGACTDKYSCVIGELGTKNEQGKPYPSAGFTAAFILAHEIGHSLGMFHDSQKNLCPSNGYIMSPSRGTRGETTWSECSRNALREMPLTCLSDLPRKPAVKNHRIFRELPGQVYDAFDQCQLLLKDPDAEIHSQEDLYNVCERVKCKSPHRLGYYYSGPALEGTFCGFDSWCISGSCRPWSTPAPPIIQGGWGDWNISTCTSGCIENAIGVAISERRCDNPKPLNTERRCAGPTTNVQFCDDSALCDRRLSVSLYASQKCREFSRLVKDIRADGVGTQVPYSQNKPWSACSVYCRLTSGTWYTPRQDLNDMNVDTYLPDGTWCHNDGVEDYYCQKHTCKPMRPDPPLEQSSYNDLTIEEEFQLLSEPGLDDLGSDYGDNTDTHWTIDGYERSETSAPTPAPPVSHLWPAPTTYRPVTDLESSRPPPTIGDAGDGDRWRHGSDTNGNFRHPPPSTEDWYSADPTPWSETPAPVPSTKPPPDTEYHSPLEKYKISSRPVGDKSHTSKGWSFGQDPARRTTLPPEQDNWLDGDDRTTAANPGNSLQSWSFGSEPATTARPVRVRGNGQSSRHVSWPEDGKSRGSHTTGRLREGDDAGRLSRPRVRSRPPSERGGRTGRVLWPNQARSSKSRLSRPLPRIGTVRWPAERADSRRWRVRPTMPTLAPPVTTVESQPRAGFLRSSFNQIWCRAFGNC